LFRNQVRCCGRRLRRLPYLFSSIFFVLRNAAADKVIVSKNRNSDGIIIIM
jgi:hypothetical protein